MTESTRFKRIVIVGVVSKLLLQDYVALHSFNNGITFYRCYAHLLQLVVYVALFCAMFR